MPLHAHGHEKISYSVNAYLAGTWDDKDVKEFTKNVKCFEEIDEELWS
jgi:hypothetical protein